MCWQGTCPHREVDRMAEFKYPYEWAAMLGEELPDGLDLVDQLNFLALRSLYAQVRAGAIDRGTGSREKARLGYQYDRWIRMLMVREGAVKASVRQLKDVELVANAYAKERTLECADRMYQALYGVSP